MAARFLPAAFLVVFLLVPGAALAVAAHVEVLDLTGHWTGLLAIAVFVVAYFFVISEESLSLRKSKPALVSAGIIWFLVAWTYIQQGDIHTAEQVFRRGLEYYTELFLFLLAAMTYINAMSERGVFAIVRVWLASRHYSLKAIYWISGVLAFVISPLADNLTTALLMSTVIVSVGGGNRRFLTVGCINVVVAANAGGVFSPFGDVTTLLVWQRGLVEFQQFFALFAPSLVNWLVPAAILSFVVPEGMPAARRQRTEVAKGGGVITVLFVLTIASAVAFEHHLHLPAAIGMMTGLGLLKLYGYYLKRQGVQQEPGEEVSGHPGKFDIFRSLERAEWDTLMFLFGTLMSVSGLAAMGYLMLASEAMYGQLGTTPANILVGVLSALVENVPMMFSVLSMRPEMDLGQWLLVTLTTGAGGSLLSIGSAAGVAVMGQARGVYTFLAHLKWAWAIALGYAASIWVHFAVNAGAFG
jgi:Na+/H+ antiporter NhaD/arsenite permease-like protein